MTLSEFIFYSELQSENLLSAIGLRLPNIEKFELPELKPLDEMNFWNFCRWNFDKVEGIKSMSIKIECQIQTVKYQDFSSMPIAEALAYFERFNLESNRIKKEYALLWRESTVPTSINQNELGAQFPELSMLSTLTNNILDHEKIYELPTFQVLQMLIYEKLKNETIYLDSKK